jgi:hypothetical protein
MRPAAAPDHSDVSVGTYAGTGGERTVAIVIAYDGLVVADYILADDESHRDERRLPETWDDADEAMDAGRRYLALTQRGGGPSPKALPWS